MSEEIHVRVVRPYPSVEAYVRGDAWTADRTGLVLVGQEALEPGVVVRFEVVLESGDNLLRGEGRAQAVEAAPDGSEFGLRVRFKRLDSESKSLVRKLLRAARNQPTAASQTKVASPPPPASAGRASCDEPSGVRQRRVAVVAAPEGRDALLERLRERARRVPVQARASAPPKAAGA